MIEQLKEAYDILSTIKKDPTSAFKDLPVESQTALVYDMATNVFSSITFFKSLQTAALDPKNPQQPTALQMAAWENEIATATATHRSLCGFLERVGNYVEADNQMINFDNASFDDIDKAAHDATLVNDEIVTNLTAVKSRPHAWAKARLQAKGAWAEFTSNTLVVPQEGLSRAMNNVTSQVIGRWLVQMSKQMRIGSRRDARDLRTLLGNPALRSVEWSEDQQTFLKQLFGLVRGQNGNVFMDDRTSMSFSNLFKEYPRMREDLEDEIQEQNIRAKSREINQKVRVRNFMNKTSDTLKAEIIKLKERGGKKADIVKLLEPFEDDLTSKQYKELLAA